MTNAIVQVENVVKVFRSEVRALDGVTLAFEPGIIYGLLGPNGAGKTTLIRVLATLLPPDEGTARVAGFDVRRNPAEVRSRIGLAGQFAAVDDFLTGRENVEMVGRDHGRLRPPRRPHLPSFGKLMPWVVELVTGSLLAQKRLVQTTIDAHNLACRFAQFAAAE